MNTLPVRQRSRGFSVVPFFGDLLVMLRLLRDGSASWGMKAVALFTLLYVVSPVDLFPEALLPVIAWVDDLGLVLTLRLALERTFAKYRYPLFGKPGDAEEPMTPAVHAQHAYVGQSVEQPMAPVGPLTSRVLGRPQF